MAEIRYAGSTGQLLADAARYVGAPRARVAGAILVVSLDDDRVRVASNICCARHAGEVFAAALDLISDAEASCPPDSS